MATAIPFRAYPRSGVPPAFLDDTPDKFCLVTEFGFIEDGLVSKPDLLDESGCGVLPF